MASRKISTFDESAYTADLIQAGLDPVDAAKLAAKMAVIRADAVAAAQSKRKLIAAGVQPEKAQALAEASQRMKKPAAPAAPALKPAARAPGFQSMADLLGKAPAPPPAVSATSPEPAAAPAAKKTPAKKTPAKKVPAKKAPSDKFRKIVPVYDYRNGQIPERVRDLIEAHLAIEQEDAKSAGSLGFMTRSLALATLPHRRQDEYRFVRRNGDFVLTMMTAHPEGLPFGVVPRMLLTWVCTEAVRTGDRVLNLGDSLVGYLAMLGMRTTGGKRGDITRLKHAMTTLFSSVISCHYEGADKWALSNVLLADRVEWWQPQDTENAGAWQSRLQLSEPFFKECVEHPIPLDMRAMRSLGSSPLALDIYVWMTHRMSYLSRMTIIPWISLQAQFGAGYQQNDRGLLDFKRAFLRELKNVLVVYPEANVSDSPAGLVMYPSATHIPLGKKKGGKQGQLEF